MFRLSELDRRRLRNFRSNKRALWSLRIFAVLFLVSLVAEVVANDKPILVSYRGEFYVPLLKDYIEKDFGGEEETGTVWTDPVVACLIRTAGNFDGCLDEDDGLGDASLVEFLA